MSNLIRLDKYITDCDVASRSRAKKLIGWGRVTVDGRVVRDPSAKVDVTKSSVVVDGEKVSYEQFRYYMLNKPAGCVSATKDKLSSTVIELLKGENTKDLFPVGRLDKDTEGLLLITNDGQLAHRLLSPKKHVDKVYVATVDKPLNKEAMEQFCTGLDIGDDKPTEQAAIEYLEADDSTYLYRVTIHEGRFHQIKRMFEALGSNVTALKRISMGSLVLDESLPPGEYRKLTEDELAKLG